MPNRLEFDSSSDLFRLVFDLTEGEFGSLRQALERIRQSPLADGVNIIAVDMPPVVIYHYRDDNWRVAFNYSYSRDRDEMDIRVVTIARL